MRVVIATVQVPFISGGAEAQAESLRAELRLRGHEAEIVTIPFKWYPSTTLVNGIRMARWLDLTEVNGHPIDVVIALKFPAYCLEHPRKVIWLLHQHRQAYDLWGTPFGDMHAWPEGETVRRFIFESDRRAFSGARAVFTDSRNVSDRLMRYNGIASTPLYHPPSTRDSLRCAGYGDFVFYPSRIDPMKRQDLLIAACRYLKSGVGVRIAGAGPRERLDALTNQVRRAGLEDRVRILGHVTDEEKTDLYARCLAVYFGGYDEDYGYIPLEAFLSSKPVIVHGDAGGPLEFVEDGVSGWVTEPRPEALAEVIDRLATDPELARRMGEAGHREVRRRRIDWDHVLEMLLR